MPLQSQMVTARTHIANLQMVVLEQSHGLWCSCEQILNFLGSRLCGCCISCVFLVLAICSELLQNLLDGIPCLGGFSGMLLLVAEEEDDPDGQLSKSSLVMSFLQCLAIVFGLLDALLHGLPGIQQDLFSFFGLGNGPRAFELVNVTSGQNLGKAICALWDPVTMVAHAAIRMNGNN